MAFDATPDPVGHHLNRPTTAEIAAVPADLLPPSGVVLLSRNEARRTPESVARQVKLFGEEYVRYAQRRGWL